MTISPLAANIIRIVASALFKRTHWTKLAAIVVAVGVPTIASAASPSSDTSDCQVVGDTCATEEWNRVDRSFSDIPIDTPLATVASRLTEIVERDCTTTMDCEWIDPAGVRHFFWADFAGAPLVVKVVQVRDVGGRPMAALGIGTARRRDEVLANVRHFLPAIAIDCDRPASGNVGPRECLGTVGPGWFQIGFSEDGQLQAVRFDGYHFT